MIRKPDAPSRDVIEVGGGDFVKVRGEWRRIKHNTAEGLERAPSNWAITVDTGYVFSPYEIERYAKAEDLE